MPYILPFAVFLLSLIAFDNNPIYARFAEPIRVAGLGSLCLLCWPRPFTSPLRQPVSATLVGAIVFMLWIAPDLLSPQFRQSVLFTNPLIMQSHARMNSSDVSNNWFFFFRTARAAVIVPVVEELFWRGWLMRWLVRADFETVPFGAYRPAAFWITAILFASEHGSYWDVGLVAGVIYNWFAIRSKSLVDCILMHGVTNALLSAYVIASGQWQYWG